MAENDWYIAGVLSLAGLALAGLMVRLDQALDLDPPTDRIWLYGGDAGGASGVLSAIASSSITVAGVIFSANFVALQLASSLYSPRVIWTLTRRHWLQVVLGTFLASFIYSLMVLRSVRSASEQEPEFVPVLAVSVAILLALASVGVLIFYVHRGAKMVQPASVIEIAAAESFNLLDAPPVSSGLARADVVPPVPSAQEAGAVVTADRSGYVQRLDGRPMSALFGGPEITIRLDRLVGSFVLHGEALATVFPGSACDAAVEAAIRSAYVLGQDRTPEQDVEYGFRRVADIALKALSPAINDPTTAMTCIDSLGLLLRRLAERPIAPFVVLPGQASASVGNIRVIWDAHFFERCVDVAFAQVRHYGASDAVVMAYLLDSLRRLAALVPANLRGALIEEAHRARACALDAITLPDDRRRVESAARWLDDAPGEPGAEIAPKASVQA
jgi:uncharacterized membrane protein